MRRFVDKDVYEAVDEQPDCARCDHHGEAGKYNQCAQFCGSDNAWYRYERSVMKNKDGTAGGSVDGV